MKYPNGPPTRPVQTKRRFDFDRNAACSGGCFSQDLLSPQATADQDRQLFFLVKLRLVPSSHNKQCLPHCLAIALCRHRSMTWTHTGVVLDMLPTCLILGE